MWRFLCAVALSSGCQNEPRATEEPASSARRLVAPADATVVADAVLVADAAIAMDATSSIDAGARVDAAPPVDANANATQKTGQGTCKTDADCELSSWQVGCCTSSCTAYAISKKLLAGRKAKETCPPKGTQLCPAPSPCPPMKFLAEKAACRRGACTAVGRDVDASGPP